MKTEWKGRGIRRRDERHTKIDDQPVPRKIRKNKKRWCKGIVGIPHDPMWVERPPRFILSRETLVYKCQKCDKELEIWFSPPWGSEKAYRKPVLGSRDPLQRKLDFK